MRLILVLCLTLTLWMPQASFAVEPDEILADPALEMRARGLSKGLRCLVCRNQSIDDSDALLAKDLRVIVRERLVAGDSDEQVLDYVVSRYGEYVLLKPRFTAQNALLYLGGPLVLLLGAFAAWRTLGNREVVTQAPVPLTDEERQALQELSNSNH